MTTPTTNLLEWIDERIADIAMAQQTTNPAQMTDVNDAISFELLEEIRNRILQEVENEKQIIINAANAQHPMSRVGIDGNDYYQQTFNPNNDEPPTTI